MDAESESDIHFDLMRHLTSLSDADVKKIFFIKSAKTTFPKNDFFLMFRKTEKKYEVSVRKRCIRSKWTSESDSTSKIAQRLSFLDNFAKKIVDVSVRK